ncbi:MAG: molybdenum cofactor biosynthesis protein MoaE [Saprospiraceae bacterium]
MHKKKNVFIDGPISPQFIMNSISSHSTKTEIGGHNIFLGQVRADSMENKVVSGIEYTTFLEVADQKLYEIREEAFEKYELTCLHIYHSLGLVQTGEICLFVFTSSKHRKAAMEACTFLVEKVKKEVPIWGKEWFDNQDYSWKRNN